MHSQRPSTSPFRPGAQIVETAETTFLLDRKPACALKPTGEPDVYQYQIDIMTGYEGDTHLVHVVDLPEVQSCWKNSRRMRWKPRTMAGLSCELTKFNSARMAVWQAVVATGFPPMAIETLVVEKAN